MGNLKKYSDTIFYNKYPRYGVALLQAVSQDPVIDKESPGFNEYVVREIRRARISDALVKILMSTNVILLDCVNPLPRTFKVFCAKNPRDKKNPNKVKAYIDCSTVIVKYKDSSELKVQEMILISYLINAGACIIYNHKFDIILRRSSLVMSITTCFAKAFTFIIDYLAKVSIQESNKVKCLYLSSMYFLISELGMEETDSTRRIAMKIAGISDRESNMMDLVMDSSLKKANNKSTEPSTPYDNIKIFIACFREAMHLSEKTITLDTVLEKWMSQYGTSTPFGLEIFPAFSAMITDAYAGAYLNRQKTIEKVCGKDMVEYAKGLLTTLEEIA